LGNWVYPEIDIDETRIAKAVARDVPVSIKDMYNVARFVKGMKLKEAMERLERVLKHKEAIPFYRYSAGTSHKANISPSSKVKQGRYADKAVKSLLKLLKNVEANAEAKNLDLDKVKIIHIASHKGLTLKRMMPRAFGRSTRKYRRTTNIEVVVAEV
jgi:large subunit ribosomal protein L22